MRVRLYHIEYAIIIFLQTIPVPLLNAEIYGGLIIRSHPSDTHYTTQQQELEGWYRLQRQQEQPIYLPTLYRYRLEQEESIIAAAARFSLPYSTVATINRIVNTKPLPKGEELIIPTAKGLFIPHIAENELETVLRSTRRDNNNNTIIIDISSERGNERFYFYPGEDFLPFERIAFFGRLFHSPLRAGRITSDYGERNDPFTGQRQFHHGIDIAARRGAPVVAARTGTIVEIGDDDPIYGHYVRIAHEGGFSTLYAHLRTIKVNRKGTINIGATLGTVGSSGHSTGPHLHFEIHLNGIPLNPNNYLYLPLSLNTSNQES